MPSPTYPLLRWPEMYYITYFGTFLAAVVSFAVVARSTLNLMADTCFGRGMFGALPAGCGITLHSVITQRALSRADSAMDPRVACVLQS